MATMSHTPAQRKAWHKGKRQAGETSREAGVRNWRERNFGAALSHQATRKGLFYAALPQLRNGGGQR